MPAIPKVNRRWIYAKPMQGGVVTSAQFAIQEAPIPQPAEGEALVKVKLVGIHPKVRANMAEGGSLKPGETEVNFACAEIIASRDPAFREGDIIACEAGWEEYAIVSSAWKARGYPDGPATAKELNRTNSSWTYVYRPSMVAAHPPEDLVGLMGSTGLTAYFGIRAMGPLTPGDTVACSGVTGATGSIAGQLAKIAGCRVVGFARGPDKCRWVIDELGLDGCVDYAAADFAPQMRDAFPNGVDVFIDGVGGDFAGMVARHMNANGRMLVYGGAHRYFMPKVQANASWSNPNAASMLSRCGISDDVQAVLAEKRVKTESWIVDDFYYDRIVAENDLDRMVRQKVLKPINTVFEGFENLPEAIISTFEGARFGKLSVRLEAR